MSSKDHGDLEVHPVEPKGEPVLLNSEKPKKIRKPPRPSPRPSPRHRKPPPSEADVPGAPIPTPRPGPSANAWSGASSGGEGDAGEANLPFVVRSWGNGSRVLAPQKRLITSGKRSARRKVYRKRLVRPKHFDLPASDGEEGLKPSRPSDIVGYFSDSCSDYAYAEKDLAAHRRRLRASIMRIKAINREGKVVPARRLTLSQLGMENYGLHFHAPTEDYVSRPKTNFDRLWTSRGNKTYRRPRKRVDEASCEASDDGESPPSAGRISDANFFESSDEADAEKNDLSKKSVEHRVSSDDVVEVVPQEASAVRQGLVGVANNSRASSKEKKYTSRKKKSGDDKTDIKKTATVEQFGYKLLSSSQKFTVGSNILSFGKRLRVDSGVGRPLKRRKQNEKNARSLMKEMNKKVNLNPEMLFGDVSGQELGSVRKPSDEKDVINISRGSQSENSGARSSSDDDIDSISLFEKMKADLLKSFYATRSYACESSSSEEEESEETIREEYGSRDGEPGSSSKAKVPANDSDNIGWTIMSRFGYTGRLGANEDGIDRALKASERGDRAGLGVQRANTNGPLPSKASEKLDGTVEGQIENRKNGKKEGTKRQAKQFMKAKEKSQAKEEPGVVSVNGTRKETDNRRRAIILDFDALTFNSHSRRVKAFESLVKSCPELSKISPDVKSMLISPMGNLSDIGAVKKSLDECGIQLTDPVVNRYMLMLDKKFEDGPGLLFDEALISKLLGVSHDIRIGFIHFGTVHRMRTELRNAGLAESFCKSCGVAVLADDTPPYLSSWREVYCRVGVPTRQSMMLLNDHGRNRILSGVIASQVLNTRNVVRLQTEAGPKSLPIPKNMLGTKNIFGATAASTEEKITRHLDFGRFTLKLVPERAHRVWALYSADNLWYAAKEMFRASRWDATKGPLHVLVLFYRYGNTEWVEAKSVRPLEHKDFLTMESYKFPGLMDPSVDALE